MRSLSLCTCCRHYPGAAAGRIVRSVTQPCQPSPKGSSGRPARRPFRGLLGVHLRYGLHTRAVTVYRDTLSEGFSHFVTSMTAPVASGWNVRRVGLAPTGKRRLLTAHVESRCGAVALGRACLFAAPFVWRCLSGSTVAPFPHPAHRTGRADFPHPALGQDLTPSSTARHAQAGSDVRARSARRDARVDSFRLFVA